MEGLGELLFPDWKVNDMRNLLMKMRAHGHPYVDLRREGRCWMFFCSLCAAPCFDESDLKNHLNGGRHEENMGGPQKTLMKQNRWPFNDGMYFVHADELEVGSKPGELPCDSNLEASHELVIPYVLQNNVASDLVVRLMGAGLILARLIEKDDFSSEIHRIWCEWREKGISSGAVGSVPEHDFAIVTFPYDYKLGRNMILDPRYSKIVDSETNQMSKSDRKRLLDQLDFALERECGICTQKFLQRKDVAALLNRTTGNFVCSSRNLAGAFHLFHVSCLVHWIMHREVEMHDNRSGDEQVVEDERPKKKRKRESRKKEQNPNEQNSVKKTLYCPVCKGSGTEIHRKVLEKPSITLREICESKIKIIDGHKEWLKSPEQLVNCGIGLTLPRDGDDELHTKRRAALKLITFYRPKNSFGYAPADALGERLASLMV